MNQITDELLRRRRSLFLAKRRKFVRRQSLGKSSGGGGLSVTVNRAPGQVSPTNTSPINFTVQFSQPVSGFAPADLNFSGSTTGGTLSGTITGTGPSYNVAVSGMTGQGDVNLRVNAASVLDAATGLLPNSVSNTASVAYDSIQPSVTINQAAGQSGSTGISPITFTVVFSEPVTGFIATDVVITGTAGGTKLVSLSGSGPTYSAEVSGMTTAGSIIANIPAGAAADLAGNLSTIATFTDNTVTWTGVDITAPSVAIVGQADPAPGATSIDFTVTFNEPVFGFGFSDIILSSSTCGGSLSPTVNNISPGVYTVTVTGMAPPAGNVVMTFLAGAAQDSAGNPSNPPTLTDNSVAWSPAADTTRPTVTIAHSGADPSSDSPQFFSVAFSEVVTGFGPATGSLDISFAGSTVGGTLSANVSTGTGDTYLVSVTGMAAPTGTLAVTVIDGAAVDASGNTSQVSNTATTTWNFVPVDTTRPTVTIVQGGSQADPTTETPIFFAVTFSEVVTGFGPATASPDISFTGSGVGGTLTANVSTGTGDTYLVSVSGMAAPSGAVVVNIIDGAAQDAAGNLSLPSAGGDNVVTWNAAPPVIDGQMDFSNPDQSGLIAILDDF